MEPYGTGGAATLALAGVDLDVRPGSLAIMGPSGSGKTTLLHCLAGIMTPTAGQVLYRGGDLARRGDRARSKLRRALAVANLNLGTTGVPPAGTPTQTTVTTPAITTPAPTTPA